MNKLIWLHEEMLRIQHPIFDNLDSNSHIFYIWDAAHIKSASLNSKRLVFIYETLCELPVTIYKGNTRDVINHLCYKHSKNEIFTPAANSVALKRLFNSLRYVTQINIIDDMQLFDYEDSLEYTRFFQFWKSIKNNQYHQGVLNSEPSNSFDRERRNVTKLQIVDCHSR